MAETLSKALMASLPIAGTIMQRIGPHHCCKVRRARMRARIVPKGRFGTACIKWVMAGNDPAIYLHWIHSKKKSQIEVAPSFGNLLRGYGVESRPISITQPTTRHFAQHKVTPCAVDWAHMPFKLKQSTPQITPLNAVCRRGRAGPPF
jgi:hypothetical protein